MADKPVIGAATSVITVAVVQAGLPLAIGFFLAGLTGAVVGVLRGTLEAEQRGDGATSWAALPKSCIAFKLFRAIVFAEFVCLLLFLLWVELQWPWTWGLIAGCISAVFAPEAIDLIWEKGKSWFRAWGPQSQQKGRGDDK